MNALSPSPVLTAALAYAAKGWRIFPCDPHPERPRSKRPLVVRDRDETGRPIEGSGWPKKASADEIQIRAWWRKWPDAMIGCSPGGMGAFVIDLDPKDEPVEAVEARLVTAMGGPLPNGPRTLTRSGGLHLWFRRPPGGPFGNDGLGLKNIDIRCDNGYVILPPSALRDGKSYAWIDGPFDPATAPDLPPGVLRLIADRKQAPGHAVTSNSSPVASPPRAIRADEPGEVAVRRYVTGARDKIAADLAATGEGQRGTALFTAACRLGRFVAGLGMSEREACAVLMDAAEANGLVLTDGIASVERDIRRGLDSGRSDAAEVVNRLRGIADEARERASRRENRPPPAMPDDFDLAPADFSGPADDHATMANGPVLYRLDEFELSEHSTAYLCASESDADALRSLGLAATAVVGGYQNWSKVLAFHFEYCEVFVVGALPNDPAWRQVFEDIRMMADSVTSVSIPGGDLVGYISANPDTEDRFPALCDAAKREKSQLDALPTFSAASLAGLAVPARRWLIPGWIPLETVAALYGDGAVGKSLLTMQLAVAIVAGRDWMGIAPQQGNVLIVSAEDDRNEIHRRLHDINQHEGIDFDQLRGLHFCDLAGRDAVIAAPDRRGVLKATPLWFKIRSEVERLKPVLVVFDTLADTFAGNENDRNQARQYVGLLRGLAIDFGLAAMFNAHPSVAGINSGLGSSGSTGWNNSVRSRLYLKRVVDESRNEPNPDMRTLSTEKANYGRKGAEMQLVWRHGVFIRDDLPGGGGLGMSRRVRAEQVFLDLVAAYQTEGRSPSPHGSSNYAPTKFAVDPRSEGFSEDELKVAMNGLLAAGRIIIEREGPPSRRRDYLRIAKRDDD